MNPADLIEISRDGIMTFFKVGMPVMVIGLLVGVIISLFQALTQIQEQTLVYVPKVVAIFGSLLLLLPFMADGMASYMARIASRISGVG
ncbi:flagellar biosynthesis protein FliQ [Rhabdaerophilum sp. SD176]|jgi:flagellar biosynthetic protein FliQ|uniref:flagellar biosynthesis protein FliQ n=1 Tax=Rhabdaerophilum sp. SD176 TaxID=2983548 RepID=UPI0022C12363|nr:flagellar biosynthesis protein FliQ [Rhabdaerophilum sp. SD176]MCZ8181540.1 flagellar biosynthesis protein FliQ [Beijerinckiaceae bacterium]MCZ8188054.1 flagellar biosynthesis protein FliQ [Beijerinckiaceae bacterium]MCZ8301859.1 flagellar biosynthesis protein FliQ [Beijerinckiaceae bacterium]MCZ8377216.1 flagellar biosynthesis protein FliQ [Beijerinckiaceae bacterium]